MSEESATLNNELITTILNNEKQKLADQYYQDQETQIKHEGESIVLPAMPKWMTEEEGVRALQRKIQLDAEEVGVNEEVDAFPLDGAYAFAQVLKKRFGWVSTKATKGLFGDTPPQTISLEIGVDTYEQVIWGEFELPGIEGSLRTGHTMKHGRPIFCLQGTIKKKHQREIKSIAEDIRAYVKEKSVYKGKAIRLKTTNGKLDVGNPPSFLDLKDVDEDQLIFSDEVQAQVTTSLFTPIEKTDLCRKYGVPLKRGVLLEGPYGTGKTLAAYVSAKKAVENGWTFIYLDKVTSIKEALMFGRMYQPAIVFAEDIDKAVSGERTVKIDEVLNHIDGIDSKNCDIMTILTTNFVEKLDKAMMRPGRLDAVITVLPPDIKAVEKLIRNYGRDLIKKDEDLAEASKELDGHIPAVIREVVERAKLYAMSRLEEDENLILTGKDLAHSARGMKRHLELMNPTKVTESTADKLANSLQDLVGLNGSKDLIQNTNNKVDVLYDNM